MYYMLLVSTSSPKSMSPFNFTRVPSLSAVHRLNTNQTTDFHGLKFSFIKRDPQL